MAHLEDLSFSDRATISEGEVSRNLGLQGLPVSVETSDLVRVAMLAGEIGTQVHLAHLSCKESVKLLAGFRGCLKNLSAEVTPHHLVLTDQAILSSGTNAKICILLCVVGKIARPFRWP